MMQPARARGGPGPQAGAHPGPQRTLARPLLWCGRQRLVLVPKASPLCLCIDHTSQHSTVHTGVQVAREGGGFRLQQRAQHVYEEAKRVVEFKAVCDVSVCDAGAARAVPATHGMCVLRAAMAVRGCCGRGQFWPEFSQISLSLPCAGQAPAGVNYGQSV